MARSVTPLLLLVCIGNLYAQDLDGQKSSNPDLGWQRGYAIELGPGPLVCYERNFGHFAFVRRNVETGKITDESAYGQMALQHSTPPPPDEPKAKDPVFTIAAQDDDYRLMQKGQKEPLQSVPKDYRTGAKILLAPEGAFAVAKLERNAKLCVLVPTRKGSAGPVRRRRHQLALVAGQRQCGKSL